jgi:hypothetical protein
VGIVSDGVFFMQKVCVSSACAVAATLFAFQRSDYSRRLDALRDKHSGRNLVTLSEFLCKFTLDKDAHTRPNICAPVAMVLRTDARSASVPCAKTCVIAHLLIRFTCGRACVIAHLLIRFTCGRACVFAHLIDNYAHAINSLLVRPEVSEA